MWQRAGKWAKRRPVHAALAAVLGTVLLAGLSGLGWARAREKRHQDELGLALDRTHRSERAALHLRALADRHRAAEELRIAGSLYERGEQEAATSILDALDPTPGLPDSRGFAWYYLDRLCQPRVMRLPSLPEKIVQAAYSNDGRTIALLDRARNIVLVDRETGKYRALQSQHRFHGYHSPVFSPDGRSLASFAPHPPYGRKTDVKIWDVASGEELAGIAEEFGLCYQLLFSPDGRNLITIEATGTTREVPIRSWRLSDDRKRVTLLESLRADQLSAHLSPTQRRADSWGRTFRFSDVLAVTPGDSSTLAVWLEDGEIRLYSTIGGYWKAACRTEGPEVVVLPRTDLNVPYTPAQVDEIGRLACTLTGCERARPIGQARPNRWARFSRDGRTAAVLVPDPQALHNATLRLIDVGSGRDGPLFPPGEISVGSTFEFAPQGNTLVVTGYDNRARLWILDDWRAPGTLAGHKAEVWGLAFSPDGTRLASAGDDWTIKLWDLADGHERTTFKGHGSLVTAVAYSPGGALLASVGFDQTVRLWDASTRQQLAILRGHQGRIRAVAFSPDGGTLATGGEDRAIRLWDVVSRRELAPPLTGHTNAVFSLAFAPDGKTLYSGSLDETIRIWDWEAGRVRAVWKADDQVYSMAIAPDGQTLAVGHHNGNIRLWDVATEKTGPPLRGHVGDVLGLAFSLDGLTLASAGRDHTVRLWEPVTGRVLMVLKGHEAPVHAVAFSPDGLILASGSHDGAIKLWRALPDRAHQTADSAKRQRPEPRQSDS